MVNKIRKKIEAELTSFLSAIKKSYAFNDISPLLFDKIRDFVVRPGKRLRPVLFIIGYRGFSKKDAPGLYTSALAIELLHDFMLVHDDIIDKSDLRRGKPSMHTMLNDHVRSLKGIKFTGQDLSIVVGDVMYAMAIDAFLAIKEKPARKELALRTFIRAAVYTGCGEFIELLDGAQPIEKITKNDILKIYNYKTAYYTFAAPLATGAILAGARPLQVDKLFRSGFALGRAFQIKDDILGMFGDERKIGKSTLTDLQEAKKTLLIWHAFKYSPKNQQKAIRKIFAKKLIAQKDLSIMRRIIIDSGSLAYAEQEIADCARSAEQLIRSSRMNPSYRDASIKYIQELLVS